MTKDKKENYFTLCPKIKVLNIQSFDDMEISEASVQDMLPKGFNAKLNIDVLPVVFNLAVVNQINANGDAMNSEAAIKCVKSFANKPINVEHKRHKIIGHMINATLSEDEFDFSDKDLNSFAKKTTPFYINAIGFIYRKIFPELAEAIVEAADSDNDEYKSISTSWELASKEFKITKGAGKNLCDCEYIEAEKYEEYRGYLKRFGGKGEDKEGNIVGRVFHGDVIPLGAGLTMNPAANVEGVHVIMPSGKEEETSKSVAKEQKNSQKSKIDVTSNKSNIFNMEDKTTQEIVDQITEAVASVVKKDGEAKSIGKLMQDTIEQHNETWKSKVEVEAQARAEAEESIKSLKEANEKMQSELDQITADNEAKAEAEAFNARMNFFDGKYNLTEQENEIIAAELKTIGQEDEAFESYKAKVEIIFAHKDKEALKKAEEEAQASKEVEDKKEEEAEASETEESEASVEEVEEEAEIETEEAEANIPNGNGEQTKEKSLLEKAKESFKYEIS
jgi:hypothetical protein